MKTKRNLNYLTVNVLVIILVIYSYNLPLNIYSVAKHPYQERLLSIYGFCGKESLGFMQEINNKYGKKNNIDSFNFDDYPKSSSVFFYKVNRFLNKDQIIVLNYNSKDLSKKEFFKKNFGSYKIIENYNNNCLFLERK